LHSASLTRSFWAPIEDENSGMKSAMARPSGDCSCLIECSRRRPAEMRTSDSKLRPSWSYMAQKTQRRDGKPGMKHSCALGIGVGT
jgi:hypothetical protein